MHNGVLLDRRHFKVDIVDPPGDTEGYGIEDIAYRFRFREERRLHEQERFCQYAHAPHPRIEDIEVVGREPFVDTEVHHLRVCRLKPERHLKLPPVQGFLHLLHMFIGRIVDPRFDDHLPDVSVAVDIRTDLLDGGDRHLTFIKDIPVVVYRDNRVIPEVDGVHHVLELCDVLRRRDLPAAGRCTVKPAHGAPPGLLDPLAARGAKEDDQAPDGPAVKVAHPLFPADGRGKVETL